MTETILLCPKPSCRFEVRTSFALPSEPVEVALRTHINTHPLWRYIMAFRAWRLRRSYRRGAPRT